MDAEAFLDMANQVVKLKMYPYFDIAHSVLCALHVREDLGPGKRADASEFSIIKSQLSLPPSSTDPFCTREFNRARAVI